MRSASNRLRQTARRVPPAMRPIVFLAVLACTCTLAFPPYVHGQDDFIIQKITFKGNKVINTSVLKTQMKLQEKSGFLGLFSGNRREQIYSEVILRRDIGRIERFYDTEGFLQARVDTFHADIRENSDVYLRLEISEGDSVTVTQLNINVNGGNDFEKRQASRVIQSEIRGNLLLKEGQRYRDAALQADRELIYRKMADGGFAYASLAPTPELDATQTKLKLNLEITPGRYCIFDTVYVEGNVRVSDRLVRKQLGFRRGEAFSRRAVEQAKSALYQLGVFDVVSVKVLLGDGTRQQVPLRVTVKEAPGLTTKLGVGVGNEDRLRLSANARILTLGGARRLVLDTKRSRLEPARIDISMTQPSFPDRKTLLTINPFFRREDNLAYLSDRLGGNLSMRRRMGTFTTGFANYTFEQVQQLRGSSTPTTLPISAPTLYNKSAISFGMIRDDSGPLFEPARGSFRSFTATVSGLGFRSVRFARLIGEYRKYWSVGDRLVLAGKVRFGVMRALEDNTEIPLEERFFAGGSNSVRGWQHLRLGPTDAEAAPVGGKNMVETSFETRFPIRGIVSGVAFHDMGNVWNGKLDRLRMAIGVGLRFQTPIGPVRIDAGKPILRDSGLDPELHFNIGHAF